jgi:hypothetical protein
MTSGWAAIYYQLLLAHCPRMPGLNIIISTEWTLWFFFLLLSRSAGPRVVWLVPLLAIFLFLILYIYAAIFFFNPWLILSVVLPGLNYLESLVRFFRSLYTCCWSACQAQKKIASLNDWMKTLRSFGPLEKASHMVISKQEPRYMFTCWRPLEHFKLLLAILNWLMSVVGGRGSSSTIQEHQKCVRENHKMSLRLYILSSQGLWDKDVLSRLLRPRSELCSG